MILCSQADLLQGAAAVASALLRMLQAIQRDFGVDAGEMRRVLGLWQEHGEAFMQWRQQPCASSSSQAAAAAPAPPAADDSGLLLEVAAAGVDVQQMQERMEGLQSYAHKLERNVRAWPAGLAVRLWLLRSARLMGSFSGATRPAAGCKVSTLRARVVPLTVTLPFILPASLSFCH